MHGTSEQQNKTFKLTKNRVVGTAHTLATRDKLKFGEDNDVLEEFLLFKNNIENQFNQTASQSFRKKKSQKKAVTIDCTND